MLRTALLEDHNGDAGAGSAAPQASGRFSGDLEGRGVVTFGDPNDADDMLGRTVAVGPAPAGLRAGTSLTSKPSTGELEVDQALDLCGGFGRANLQQFLVCAFAWCSYAFHAVGATYIKRADINCDDELERDMSLVCEFGLTDERRWVSDLASSAFFVGWFLGAPLFGYLSDRFGRKAVSFGALWWMNVSALLLAGAPNEWFLLACNVLLGMGVGGTGIVTFTLATEFFPQSRASDLTCWFQISFTVGLAIAPFYALLASQHGAMVGIARWRTTQLLFTVPGIIVGLIWWCLAHESPRWLLVARSVAHARAALEAVALTNGVGLHKLSAITLRHARRDPDDQYDVDRPAADGPFSLWTHSAIRMRTLASQASWFAAAFSYYGIIWNRETVTIDFGPRSFYWTGAFFAAVELPAYFIAAPILDRTGRRSGSLAFFAALSVTCFMVLLVDPLGMGDVGRLSLNAFGMFVSKAVFVCVYLWASELFPTSVRSVGIGVASATARIGGIAAPWAVTLGNLSEALDPLLFFGAVAILAGLLCFFSLPETVGMKTPETIADIVAANLGSLREGRPSHATIRGARLRR